MNQLVKKYFHAAVLLLFIGPWFPACSDQTADSSSSPNSKSPEEKIIGEWSATYKDKLVSVIFNADKSSTLIEGNMVMEGSWKLDSTHDPMWLDISVDDESQTRQVFCILKFLSDEKFLMRSDMDSRPEGFSEEVIRKQLVFSKK